MKSTVQCSNSYCNILDLLIWGFNQAILQHTQSFMEVQTPGSLIACLLPGTLAITYQENVIQILSQYATHYTHEHIFLKLFRRTHYQSRYSKRALLFLKKTSSQLRRSFDSRLSSVTSTGVIFPQKLCLNLSSVWEISEYSSLFCISSQTNITGI